MPELMLCILALLVIVGDLLERDAPEEQRFRDAGSTVVLGLGLIFIVTMLQAGYLIDRNVNPALQPADVTNGLGSAALTLLRNLQGVQGTTLLNGGLLVDDLLMISRLVFIGSALITTLLVQDYGRTAHPAEFFAL